MVIRPVEDGIFSLGSDGPRLLGSRCTACGTHMFPVQDGCPRCTATSMKPSSSPRGTLWTWTIQGFPPKSPPYIGDTDPERFVPFGVGYVELPGQVKVEARLTEGDPARLADRHGDGARGRAARDRRRRHRDRDVRVRATADGGRADDRRRHRRHRHARVRPHRRGVRHGPGRGRRAPGARRRRVAVGGHAVRLRRLGRRLGRPTRWCRSSA